MQPKSSYSNIIHLSLACASNAVCKSSTAHLSTSSTSTTDAVCSCKTCSSRRLPVVRPEGQRPQSTAPYNCCRRQHLSGHGACCMKASGCCRMPPLFRCCTMPPASRCCVVPPLFRGCTGHHPPGAAQSHHKCCRFHHGPTQSPPTSGLAKSRSTTGKT